MTHHLPVREGGRKRLKPVYFHRWACVFEHSGGVDLSLFDFCQLKLFKTRAEARAYNEKRFGYIKRRPDLKAAPHHWRFRAPVRVTVRISPTGANP